MKAKDKRRIEVLDNVVTVVTVNDQDYISLTDMLRAKDGDFFISDWLRNRNTVEFLGIWETVHNPNFNYGGFATIKSQVGLNSYKLSVKEWVEQTDAIGLVAKAGRYGGTYAHSDLAFEFGMWISPEFKIYLIKEFQRLKKIEQEQSGWDVRRNNENTNGLLRQYFPKGTDFRTLSQCDVDMAVDRINNRPRKTLGFKTAARMMEKSLSRMAA